MKYSAATVRNEMAKLLGLGFLEMMHTSSGRIPTPMAYKLFLDELMEEEDIPVLQEVAIKQKLWPERFDFYKLLRQAALSLSDATKELALATTNEGYLVHAGAVNVLDSKEFWDIDVTKEALGLLDRYELLERIFSKVPMADKGVYCIIGEELGGDVFSKCSMLFSPYRLGKRAGYIAVLGPSRMRYPSVIPAIKYTRDLVEELGESW